MSAPKQPCFESERRPGATQNNVGVGIHELDELGRYLHMNQTFTRMCGYTIEDFADRTIFDGIADEDDTEAAKESYRQLIRGEIGSYVEERSYVTKDGHRAWVEVQTTAVRDDEGRFLYAVRAIHDVTQRRNAEVAKRESEAKLAIELADTQQLQNISSQLIHEENSDALYEQILDAAIALMRSDMASLQMLDSERQELRLLAWKGFHPDSAVHWGFTNNRQKWTAFIRKCRGVLRI